VTIGELAFAYCSALTELEIPSTVTTIGTSAFRYCSQLATLAIPSGVVTIGLMAFAYCSALMELEIPSTVAAIGVGFIWACSALRRLKIPSDYQTTEPRLENEFKDVTKVEQLTLLGRRLAALVADLESCLSSTARVIGPDLAGQRFGRFAIAAA
jgi:hypothetical protein